MAYTPFGIKRFSRGGGDRQGSTAAKYREERDKRLRPDGNEQYLRLAGQLSHYLDDPYTPVDRREPRPIT